MAPEIPEQPPGPAAVQRPQIIALLGVFTNGLALLLLPLWWLHDRHLRTANLVVGLAAVLPIAATGLVGSLAELRRSGWGRIVSIVALALSLAVELSYGITRLALVAEGRGVQAIAWGLSWILTLLLLLERCLRATTPTTP
jgi:hypothetical protein